MKKAGSKYVVVFLIEGKAKQDHQALSREISRRFNVADDSKKIAPHITLKHLGEIQDPAQLQGLEKVLGNFCESEKKFEVNLSGINYFGEDTVFIDVELSSALKGFYHRLYHELFGLKWMSTNEYEGANIHFHTTLAADDIKKNFKSIYEYLSDKHPSYTLTFDNVTILKKDKSHWRTHKSYRLK